MSLDDIPYSRSTTISWRSDPGLVPQSANSLKSIRTSWICMCAYVCGVRGNGNRRPTGPGSCRIP